MWELFSCSLPYKDYNSAIVRECVTKGERLGFARGHICPKGYIELAQRCWHQDPNTRPEISQVLDAISIIREENKDLASLPVEVAQQVQPDHPVKRHKPKHPSQPVQPTTKKMEVWHINEVSKWTKSLCLSQDYSNVWEDENIDGGVLADMSAEDLESIGISSSDASLIMEGKARQRG